MRVNVWVTREWGVTRIRIIDKKVAVRWSDLTGMIIVPPSKAIAAAFFGIELVCHQCQLPPFDNPLDHIKPHLEYPKA